MHIEWLNSKYALDAIGLEAKYHDFIHLAEAKEKPDLEVIKLVFNSKSHITAFLESCASFNWDHNSRVFALGLVSDRIQTEFDFSASFDLNDPVIWFGTNEQEKKFQEYFRNKMAKIAKKGDNQGPVIAYQRHLSGEIHPMSVSLGDFKTHFDKAESQVRAARAIFFNLNAIRRQDSYFDLSHITGLDIYEACQLLRFCGLSSDHSFLFYNIGYNSPLEQSWECIATTIWYYIEGKNNKNIEMVDEQENQLYFVENSLFDEPVNFIKGYQTKRWWLIHPETKEKIPCAESDYISLRDGHIPDILLNLCVE